MNLKSKITQKILGYVVLHDGSEMYVNEMCRRFDVDRGNLVRKLHELEREGILKSEWKGNQRYYSLNSSFPLLKEYKKIILKTIGFEHLLKESLRKVEGVQKAVLFGSYARGQMDLSSDLDLLVIGTHQTVGLGREIAKLQKKVDREINVISMGPEEYRKKKDRDPLLQSILRRKKVPIL